MRKAMKMQATKKEIVELAEALCVFQNMSFDEALVRARKIKEQGEEFCKPEVEEEKDE